MASTASKVRYSPSEQQLLNLLPKDGTRITTSDLVNKRYGKNVPLNGQKIVMSAMRSLIDKVVIKREPFRVRRSTRRGPKPIEFWIDQKKDVSARPHH